MIAGTLNDAFVVIRHMAMAMHVEEEMDEINSIDSMLNHAQAKRSKRIEEEESEIKKLEEELSRIRKSTTRDALNWKSRKEQEREMHRLKTQQFDMAKKLNEVEDELGILDREAKELGRSLEDMEVNEVENEVGEDFDSITLSLFRKLGFIPTYSSDPSAPELVSILARSDVRNRATEIDVRRERCRQLGITPFALADQLWKAVD